MISQNLLDLVNEFHQSNPELDNCTTEEAYYHDALHSFTGLSVTLEDEEIVLNIAEVLSGGECTSKNEERVMFFLDIMVTADIELFTEIANYFSNN